MGCCKSKNRSLDEVSECAERESLLASQEEEGEYTVSPLPQGDPNQSAPPTSYRNGSGEFQRPPNPGSGLSDSQTRSGHLQHDPTKLSTSRYSQPHSTTLSYQSNYSLTSLEASGGKTPPNLSLTNSAKPTADDIRSVKGREILANLKKAYEWRDQFSHPSQEFLSLMDRLYMECQLHLTAMSSRGDQVSRREADAIVYEMVILRNHWGPKLLPNSVCNAFVRERIPITLGIDQRQFRVDCAQFFEPVPFYGNQQGNPGELMKMFRFSVYDVSKNEVVLRYYLERSNVIQLYHVLCYMCDSNRGQVHPYGSEPPAYWEIRQHMLEDVYARLLSALSRGSHPAPMAHISTTFPTTPDGGPVVIQVPGPTPVVAVQN